MNKLLGYLPSVVILPPIFLFFALGFFALLRELSENLISKLVQITISIILFLSAINLFFINQVYDSSIFKWYVFGHHEFNIAVENNLLTASYCFVFTLIAWVVGFFAKTYLHKDPGFLKFYSLYLLFYSGVMLTIFSWNMDALFVGWEFVGICSVLLIGFYHQRPSATKNSLYTFIYYRIGEIFLISALTISHIGHGNVTFYGLSHEQDPSVLFLFLLVIATYVKAAQFPFCSWLPRAMEGPTPSSGIFYGGLSTHMGPMVLIKLADYLDRCPQIQWMLIGCGLLTIIYASSVQITRSDIKSQIAYAAIAQLGLIFVLIGCSYYKLAAVYSMLHAMVRTFQLLKSPSILKSYLEKEAYDQSERFFSRKKEPSLWTVRLYKASLYGFYLEKLMNDLFIRPFWKMVFLVKKTQLFFHGKKQVPSFFYVFLPMLLHVPMIFLTYDGRLHDQIHPFKAGIAYLFMAISFYQLLVSFGAESMERYFASIIKSLSFILLSGACFLEGELWPGYLLCLFGLTLSLIGLIFCFKTMKARYSRPLLIEDFAGFATEQKFLSLSVLCFILILANTPMTLLSLGEDIILYEMFHNGLWLGLAGAFIYSFMGVSLYRFYTQIFTGQKVSPLASIPLEKKEKNIMTGLLISGFLSQLVIFWV